MNNFYRLFMGADYVYTPMNQKKENMYDSKNTEVQNLKMTDCIHIATEIAFLHIVCYDIRK